MLHPPLQGINERSKGFEMKLRDIVCLSLDALKFVHSHLILCDLLCIASIASLSVLSDHLGALGSLFEQSAKIRR